MYIQNETSSWQSFSVDGVRMKLEPKGMGKDYLQLTEEQMKSPTIQKMMGVGVVSIRDDQKGIAAEKKAMEAAQEAAKERKLEVEAVSAQVKAINRMVQCAAAKANGERCSGHVNVLDSEFDPDTPYFCHRHKNEKAEDYDRVGNGWVKKEQA